MPILDLCRLDEVITVKQVVVSTLLGSCALDNISVALAAARAEQREKEKKEQELEASLKEEAFGEGSEGESASEIAVNEEEGLLIEQTQMESVPEEESEPQPETSKEVN